MENEAREMINNVEDSKDNPVSEPLFLFLYIVGIETDERFECWVSNSNKASNVAGTNSEYNAYNTEDKAILCDLVFFETGKLFDLFHLSKLF
jgi:hypothetical protein